jgi:hypothetical protein
MIHGFKKNRNMEIENALWDNYTDDSLDFILEQAEKLLYETFSSFRQITNKSYVALAFYVSFMAYCFDKILNEKPFNLMSSIPYLVVIMGLIGCIIIIWKNLFPSNMSFPGSKPIAMVHPYFEQFKEVKQIRTYKIAKINDYNNGIKTNNDQQDIIISRFTWSIKLLLR